MYPLSDIIQRCNVEGLYIHFGVIIFRAKNLGYVTYFWEGNTDRHFPVHDPCGPKQRKPEKHLFKSRMEPYFCDNFQILIIILD